MNAYVGITDSEWFGYLRAIDADEPLDEVNFWRPSGRDAFRALTPGEPFLFKLHAPDHFIVGGGFFAHFSRLPYRTAWDFFAEKNGASTLSEMRLRIEKYRRVQTDPGEDYLIGCIILTEPFFLDRAEWIPVPADWSRHIQRGKGYDLREGLGAELWREVLLRLQAKELAVGDPAEVGGTDTDAGAESGRLFPSSPEEPDIAGPMWGQPLPTRRRLGQGAFRSLVTDTYERRCAITHEKALPVLEAAHILPVSEGGQHAIENGVLLRSDLHRLYDRGYLTVTPKHRVKISRRLKTDFENGEPYYPLEDTEIWLPPDLESRPSSEYLEWHADNIFRR